jgi:hypothetical protein
MTWKKGRSFIGFTRLVAIRFSLEGQETTGSMLPMAVTVFCTLARTNTAASLKPADKSQEFPLYLERISISEIGERSQ